MQKEILEQNRTFETFTETEMNQHAVKGAKTFVTEKGSHNLLYIYGAPGTGKSHLLNAIGIEVLSNTPDARILKTSFEEMLKVFIVAISSEPIKEKVDGFRKKYTAANLLLIDDVDRVKGKLKGQKELACLLNEILEENKRIAVAGRISPEIMLQSEYEDDFAEVLRSGYSVGTSTEFAGSTNRNMRSIVRDVCSILDKYKYSYFIEEEMLWRYDIVIPFAKDLELRVNCNPRNEYVRFRLKIEIDPKTMEEKHVRLLEACDNINRSTEFLKAGTFKDCVLILSEIPPKIGDALEQLVVKIIDTYNRDLDLELINMAIKVDEDLYEYTARKADNEVREIFEINRRKKEES